MNEEDLVFVEYKDPEGSREVCGVGWSQETSHHLLLISEAAEGLDLYTYTIIPKEFIKSIRKLKAK